VIEVSVLSSKVRLAVKNPGDHDIMSRAVSPSRPSTVLLLSLSRCRVAQTTSPQRHILQARSTFSRKKKKTAEKKHASKCPHLNARHHLPCRHHCRPRAASGQLVARRLSLLHQY
jgi:hypothetical protein